MSHTRTRARTFALATDFLAIGAVAAGGVTTLLWFSRAPKSDDPRVRFGLGPLSFSARGSF